MWYDLFDDKTDLALKDFSVSFEVTFPDEMVVKKEGVVKPVILAADACGFCGGTGKRPVLDGGNGKQKCLVCSGTGRKREFKTELTNLRRKV